MFPRHPMWAERLRIWSDARRGEPYRWGRTDCGMLVRDALVCLYGEPADHCLPRWDDCRGAVRALAATGGIEAELWRWEATPVLAVNARPGDIVLERPARGDLEAAGVVLDGVVLVADPTLGVTVARWDVVRPMIIFHLPGA